MRALAALLLVAGAAQCGEGAPGPTQPEVGTLMLTFVPRAPSVANLELAEASVRVERIWIFGDVAPDSHMMISDADVDVLAAPRSLVFDQAPQGLYSRVRFEVERIRFQGRYAGRPIQADIETEEERETVDLRDLSGHEVGPGSSADLVVAADGSGWFDGVDLSTAQLSGDQIVIDAIHNLALGQAIAARAIGAFSIQE